MSGCGVSASVHFPDGLVIFCRVFLFLVEGEGLLALVGSLFILLFFAVKFGEGDEFGEGLLLVEEGEVVAAACGQQYMREARKDSSSLSPITCSSVTLS